MKKSQAALEFLTTYAWAFIVIAIVIAAIAYFGILKPSKILPDRCTFNVGFGCEAYKIGSDGTFNLRLKNSLGFSITPTTFTLTSDTATDFECTTMDYIPSTLVPDDLATGWGGWAPGVVKEVNATGCNSGPAGFVGGDKGKVSVKIEYYDVKSGPSFGKIADGEIFTTVAS